MDQDAYAKNNVPEKGAKPGVYSHPSSNEVLEVTEFAQADALVRQGWVFEEPLLPANVRAERDRKRQEEADRLANVPQASQPVSNANDKKGNK